ncbi:MAG TPA: M24 family metallopeptidase [Candidatus Paceibacterota bacterium]|nr:M24 family metallopeptidase [Candidatus Paceibacterota bacterium]
MWTKRQIRQHEEAAKKLAIIKDEVASLFKIKSHKLNEKDCLTFIKAAYKKHSLVNDNKKEFAITAFSKNTREVHYFPKAKGNVLKPNTLILLDMWARLNKKGAPYADATFMFFKGSKVPKEIQTTWRTLIKARNAAIKCIEKGTKKSGMPRGLDVDRVAHDIIGQAGLGKGIKHTIGHSLGLDSPHGKLPGINWREYSRLSKNVGYTIEPGIYLENFGLRTEIDFYVTSKNKVIITTPLQDNIEYV